MFEKKYTLEELPKIATWLIEKMQYDIMVFYADMGAGKTTLIKEILKQLGIRDEINSPTFSIVNLYEDENKQKIFHFDMYRIEEEEEAYDFGIEEYFYSGFKCFVEWPERIENILDMPHHKVYITINEDFSRTIKIE